MLKPLRNQNNSNNVKGNYVKNTQKTSICKENKIDSKMNSDTFKKKTRYVMSETIKQTRQTQQTINKHKQFKLQQDKNIMTNSIKL